MRLTLSSPQVAVFDDVLAVDQLAALRNHLEKVPYAKVNSENWMPAWRLEDAQPMQGPTLWKHDLPDLDRSVLDGLMARLDECLRLRDVERLVGREHIDWSRLGFSPWIYPVGSALALHVDGRRYTGAFTFYLHAEWRLRWGGWLAVPDFDGEGHLPPVFDDSAEADLVGRTGLALAIVPLPNRLVLLSERAPHMITRVDLAAGDRPRLSLSGFFYRRDTQ